MAGADIKRKMDFKDPLRRLGKRDVEEMRAQGQNDIFLLRREIKKSERKVMSKRQNEGKHVLRKKNKQMMRQKPVSETEVIKQ